MNSLAYAMNKKPWVLRDVRTRQKASEVLDDFME